MRISDWSSDVCSSDLGLGLRKSTHTVVRGFDVSDESARSALAAGAVDEIVSDLAAGVRGASLVVVATPVGEVLTAIEQDTEERRLGKECVRSCRSWWSTVHTKNKHCSILKHQK